MSKNKILGIHTGPKRDGGWLGREGEYTSHMNRKKRTLFYFVHLESELWF